LIAASSLDTAEVDKKNTYRYIMIRELYKAQRSVDDQAKQNRSYLNKLRKFYWERRHVWE